MKEVLDDWENKLLAGHERRLDAGPGGATTVGQEEGAGQARDAQEEGRRSDSDDDDSALGERARGRPQRPRGACALGVAPSSPGNKRARRVRGAEEWLVC